MKDIKELTVKELLNSSEYRIPIYQRNYAWGMSETMQLIQDITDYAKDTPASNYYIGNLIVFPRYNDNHLYYETIDGQQRTTTLTILMCALKHTYAQYDFSWYSKVNISFDHREKSNHTLRMLFDNPDTIHSDLINTDILAIFNKAYSIIEKTCKDMELKVSNFIDYLLNKVVILRICVPKDTNLNHYFEIMNSRGEQLEQHEIVKAKLMSAIKDDLGVMATFNMIWEACSNMDRYVQLNFPKDIRKHIFENNGTGKIHTDFDKLRNYLVELENKSQITDNEKKSLNCLFEDSIKNSPYNKPWEENRDNDQSEAFDSLISFSNFLLQVLKILNPENRDVVLDDKRLSKIFDLIIDVSANKEKMTKDFIMQLLELRFLFDKYIIKRKQDKWSLKKILPQKSDKEKYYYLDTFSANDSEEDNLGKNREIIALLSMFHVSDPSPTYKHWMNACLYYIYNHKDASASEYEKYLWELSKVYMLDRYLAPTNKEVPFETIIYQNKGKNINKPKDISWANINIDEYPQVGERVENFVFNFYDYLLWRKNKDLDKDLDFEFSTTRTSVEHFYPQHPTDKDPMDFNYLHSFGNLCIVSRGMNSKFTNNLPGAKYENFGSEEAMKTYSLKLKAMLKCIKNGETWDETKIAQKEQEARDLISEALSS